VLWRCFGDRGNDRSKEKVMTPDEKMKVVILARNVEFNYGLDEYTNKQLVKIRNVVKKAKKETVDYVTNKAKKGSWSEKRAYQIIDEMDRITLGTQKTTAGMIAEVSSNAGVMSLEAQNNILSFDGRVPGFNNVALSKTQFREFLINTPIGGRVLNAPTKANKMGWIDRTFNVELKRKIQSEISAGALRGEGYPKLVKRLKKGFDNLTDRELLTLTRSYVHSANVNAMDRVYQANSDLIVGVKWTSVLESGYGKTGRGTCVRCAALDGNIYKS
jgi:hypothetical protein